MLWNYVPASTKIQLLLKRDPRSGIFRTISSEIRELQRFCNVIEQFFDQLQRNQCKKQFIEISLKSLVWSWVTFPLPTILVCYNNTI